ESINKAEKRDLFKKIIQEIGRIEESGGMRPTGLINNTNLLTESTYEDLLEGEGLLRPVADATGIPLIYTGIVSSLDRDDRPVAGEKIPLRLYFKNTWL
ncbi:MAG TPA: hypothetical protein PLZ76_03005, partial [Bacillota bacterium]|nr:hypothetical protein [Bacillota bacterium]